MHKGFTQTTLGLLAAALLSSSAFAAGPTISQLPSVFITPNTSVPGDPDEGDATPATNVYRFTDAFSLADYVGYDDENPLTTDDLDQVKWLFQEFDESAPTTPLTGAARTIAIGEDTATAQLGSATATHGDIVASTLPNVGQLANGLDFWNQALSPSLSANGTAPSGGEDVAIIELFVGVTAAPTDTPSSTFLVYTTNDTATYDSDQLATGSSSVWIPELCIDTFGGWMQSPPSPTTAGGATQTPSSGFVSTISITDNPNTAFQDFLGPANLTPGSTATLFNQTTAGTGTTQFAYASWTSLRRDIPGMVSVPVPADNTLFMVRWSISADGATQAAAAATGEGSRRATSVQTPLVRLRTGEPTHLGNGQNEDYWGPVGVNSITGINQEVRSYFYAKEGGNYDTAEGLVDYADSGNDPNNFINVNWVSDDNAPALVGMSFDILDQTATGESFAASVGGQRLYGLTLNQVEVYSTSLDNDRQNLGTGTVVYNTGVSPITVAAGEPQPPTANYTQFDSRHWDPRTIGTRATTSADVTAPVVSNAPLTMTFAAGATFAQATWDTLDYTYQDTAGFLLPSTTVDGQGNLTEIVTVDNNKLIAIDVWMSSPQGSTANNVLPGLDGTGSDGSGVSVMRIGFQTEFWGGTGAGIGPAPTYASPDDPDMPGTNNAYRQGRGGLFHFSGNNREQQDTAHIMPAAYALQTGARRITAFYEPQAIADLDNVASLALRPTIEAYVVPSTGTGLMSQVAGTIQIQRVVVTTYDLNLAPAGICP